jgi:hypothetical protein
LSWWWYVFSFFDFNFRVVPNNDDDCRRIDLVDNNKKLQRL